MSHLLRAYLFALSVLLPMLLIWVWPASPTDPSQASNSKNLTPSPITEDVQTENASDIIEVEDGPVETTGENPATRPEAPTDAFADDTETGTKNTEPAAAKEDNSDEEPDPCDEEPDPCGPSRWDKWLRHEWQSDAEFERRLFLVILLAGATGSVLHALSSLANFVGTDRFRDSWTLWYFARPIIGAITGVIFYVLIRGGLLTADVGAENINPYGLTALAFLSGMFSDRAALKLKEVFETMFRTDDSRTDPLEIKPVISNLDPERVGIDTAEKITLYGSGFVAKSKVIVEKESREATFVSDKELEITLTKKDTKKARELRLSVKNPDGSESAEKSIKVK